MMKGLRVEKSKFIQQLVRSAVLTGHSDKYINSMIRAYIPNKPMELVDAKIDERV